MIILMLSLFSSAQACTYQLNHTQVQVGDRSIYYGDYLNQKIQAKGYSLVLSSEAAKFKVEMNFQTINQDHFQHAHAIASIQDLSTAAVIFRESDVRCYTQNCIAKDAAKVIRKSIDELGIALPQCKGQ